MATDVRLIICVISSRCLYHILDKQKMALTIELLIIYELPRRARRIKSFRSDMSAICRKKFTE